MLAIKLSRVGKKKQPHYRLIVSEKGRDPWGKVKEVIGHYHPLSKPKVFEVKKDRVDFYISNGAQPTDTVQNLLINFGYLKAAKRRAVTAQKTKKKDAKKK